MAGDEEVEQTSMNGMFHRSETNKKQDRRLDREEALVVLGGGGAALQRWNR